MHILGRKKTAFYYTSSILTTVLVLVFLIRVLPATLELNPLSQSVIYTRLVLVWFFCELIIIAAVWRHELRKKLRHFFSVPTHPLNLAVARIVFFWFLMNFFSVGSIRSYAQMPGELLYPPPGWTWILSWLPITETLISNIYLIFIVGSLFAMLGLFSRTSALIAGIAGIYLLGVPQFFGKINHYHHLIWFCFIFASSKSGAFLSLDRVILKSRRQDTANTEVRSSAEYSIPLRLMWILMGVIYFFPGLGKLWSAGMHWAFSDNLKYRLYAKWYEHDWQLPILRIDEWPVLLQVGGLFTIIFELLFIVMIFNDRTRYLAVVGGLLFHFSTKVFMFISFMSLQVCYVFLIDWYSLYRRIFPNKENDESTLGVAPHGLLPLKSLPFLVGVFFIFINSVCGVLRIDTWPFGYYPVFSGIKNSEIHSIQLVAHRSDGSSIVFDEANFRRKYSPERVRGLLRKLLREEGEQSERRVEGLVKLLNVIEPTEHKYVRLKAYSKTINLDFINQGEAQADGPILLIYDKMLHYPN